MALDPAPEALGAVDEHHAPVRSLLQRLQEFLIVVGTISRAVSLQDSPADRGRQGVPDELRGDARVQSEADDVAFCQVVNDEVKSERSEKERNE